jgi:hypothetical protein
LLRRQQLVKDDRGDFFGHASAIVDYAQFAAFKGAFCDFANFARVATQVEDERFDVVVVVALAFAAIAANLSDFLDSFAVFAGARGSIYFGQYGFSSARITAVANSNQAIVLQAIATLVV